MDSEGSFLDVQAPVEAVHSISDDEDSFVVLETAASLDGDVFPESPTDGEVLPPIRTNKLHEMQNALKRQISECTSETLPELPSAVSATGPATKLTISPDTSYEEIQKHVEEIIRENETLKGIIAQNNLSMKSQYEKFLLYRNEVTSVMKTYKEKFGEAKTCIDKLREENTKLVNNLEVYVNIKKLHEEEIINLKDKIKVLGQGDDEQVERQQLQDELAATNLKLNELMAYHEKVGPEVDLLQKELQDMKKELLKSAIQNEKLEMEKEELSKKIAHDVEMKEELLRKNENVQKLTEELETVQGLKQQLQSKEQEINVLRFDISTKEAEMARAKTLIQDIKQENINLRIAQEPNRVKEDLLKMKDMQIANLIETVDQLHTIEKSLNEKIVKLKTKLKSVEQSNASEENSQIRGQLSVAQQTIIALKSEEQDRIAEIEKLRRIVQESTASGDEMFALKQQLEVYRSDYEAEKESKANLKKEKDQVDKDLKNLQDRIKQLQGEVEVLRARIQPKAEGYTCPKCNFGFNSYQSLENHVHRCLELEGFP